MKNISKELRAQIPKFEPGKVYRFKLLGVKYDKSLKRTLVPNSKKVLSQDVIYDPHLGHQVEISCIERTMPTGRDSSKEFDTVYKKIFFKKDEAGVKTLYGKNKGDQALFEYLWLSNYNKANSDKEWFIRPRGGCMYEYLEPEKSASEKVEMDKQRHRAESVVFGLSEEDLRTACEALGRSKTDDFKYHQTMNESQLQERLLAFARKSPKRVLTLDKDLNLEVRRAIKEAKSAGVISFDIPRSQIVWSDSGERICVIEPGKDAETTLVGYFVTEKGSQVLKTILANLQGGGESTPTKSKGRGRKPAAMKEA